MGEEFVIIIDTREQKPYSFEGATVCKALQSGDYSIAGMEERVAVERKQVKELFKCVSYDRGRFLRELDRLSKMEYAAVVVEGGLRSVLLPHCFSKVSPKAVVNSLISWSIQFGVHIFFADSRPFAQALTFRILERFWKHRRKVDE